MDVDSQPISYKLESSSMAACRRCEQRYVVYLVAGTFGRANGGALSKAIVEVGLGGPRLFDGLEGSSENLVKPELSCSRS